MSKNKLAKFAEVANFRNVIEPEYKNIQSDYYLKGKWSKDFFRNSHPLALELACGKGEYTVGLARKYPARNFIGVDVKGARIWTGSKYALENNLDNAAFLRIQIERLEYFFAENEVNEIWIIFPDPQPQKPRTKKRLTSPRFLEKYGKTLHPGGLIHLKTDNDQLFNYTLEVIEEYGHKLHTITHDLYNSDLEDDILSIKTFYEKMFLNEGKKINYCNFSLKQV